MTPTVATCLTETTSTARLYHHFSTVVVPEMYGGLGSALTIWRSTIPALSFENEHVIHAIMAIAAKDIELKFIKNKQLRRDSVKYEMTAMQSLGKALQGPATPSILLSILILLWLATLSDEDARTKSHLKGVRDVLRLIPSQVFETQLGKELLMLYARLDLTKLHTRRLTTKISDLAIFHKTKLMHNLMMSPEASISMSYELWRLICEKTEIMRSDATFLRQIAEPLTKLQQTQLLILIPRLCSWYTSALQLPEFEADFSECFPYGSATYRTPSAAILLVLFYDCMNSVYRHLNRASFFDNEITRSYAIKMRQILAGAVDASPSDYSRAVLRQSGTIGIFFPLYATSDSISDPLEKQWQVDVFNKIAKSYARSVWDFIDPAFFYYRHARQALCFKEMPKNQTLSTMGAEQGLLIDQPPDLSSPTRFLEQKVSTYSIHQLDDMRMVVWVTDSELRENGSFSCETDPGATAHWTQLISAVDYSHRADGDVEPGTVEHILREHNAL